MIRAWVQLAADPPRQVIPPALFGFASTGAVEQAINVLRTAFGALDV